MKEMRILQALDDVDDRFVKELYEQKGTRKARVSLKRGWMIAAIVAAMMLLMGCAWGVVKIARSPLDDMPLVSGEQVPHEDIYLTVSEVTPVSVRLHCRIAGMEAGKAAINILRGAPFTLEKKTESGWEEIKAQVEDPRWSYDTVLSDGILDWTVDWSLTHGILKAGEYRLTTMVLENNAPASVTFTVEDSGMVTPSGESLNDQIREIVNGDCFCIRLTERFEFGSFEKLTKEQIQFIENENSDPLTYEFLKYGDDLATLGWKQDHLWVGAMYKDGQKYSADHAGDDRSNEFIGWSLWPDMDLNDLTWWVAMLLNPQQEWEATYSPEGRLEKVTQVTHYTRYRENYDCEANYILTIEFLDAKPDEIAAKLQAQDVNTSLTFSWKEEQKVRKALDVAYINTEPSAVHSPAEALEQAKKECTVEHTKVLVYRDEAAGMWKVEFQIMYGYQGYQFVYLNDEGITQMISAAGSKVPEWQYLYPDP